MLRATLLRLTTRWSLDQVLTAPKTKLWEWWEQAKRETSEDKCTLLVFKKNRQPYFVMLRETHLNDKYQIDFIKSSPIRVTDRQGESAYIRLFEDLLKEPKKLWLKRLKSK